MLITVEGIDGSGKSAVCAALEARFPHVVTTAEPTASWYGDAVRRSIEDDDADPLAELFLYTADHADHLAARIRPALEQGQVVISDRYIDSRYAYQGTSLDGIVDAPLDFVIDLHEPWTRIPDHTIYLDVSPAIGSTRSGATNKFEQAAFLEQVATNYEAIIDRYPDRFVRVDAEKPLNHVVDVVAATVDSWIG